MPIIHARIAANGGKEISADPRHGGIEESMRDRLLRDGCDALFVFDQAADRDAFMAKFKRGVKVKAAESLSGSRWLPAVTFYASTAATGATGAANEASIRRIADFIKTICAVFPA